MYKPVIGLEIHIEQNTNSKMFCECPADAFAKTPNSQVCPVCLGLPGALPFANAKAVENTLMLALAVGAKVPEKSKFDRKHYFYPDLPKAYQISQYDEPISLGGTLKLSNGKVVEIRRIHLEEDTGKLTHTTNNGQMVSLIDYNRSGIPLIEMVTEPCFESVEEVDEFLKEVQLIVKYLNISLADMEKGTMRLEANISVTNTGELPNYKVELKNINSFKFLKKAVEAEIERQTQLLEKGETPAQETRGYDKASQKTYSQRTKEEAHDYRYFPEPDLPPLTLKRSDVTKIESELPELPIAKRERFESQFGLSKQYSDNLTQDKSLSEYFEKAVEIGLKENISAKEIASVIVNKHLHEEHEEPASLVKHLYSLQNKDYIGEKESLEAIKQVISESQNEVLKYKEGKVQLLGFFVGQTQKILKGKGDPRLLSSLIEKTLKD